MQEKTEYRAGQSPKKYRCLNCKRVIGYVQKHPSRGRYLRIVAPHGIVECYGYTRYECDCGLVTEWHPGQAAIDAMLNNHRTRRAARRWAKRYVEAELRDN